MSDLIALNPQILTIGLNAIVNANGASFEIAEIGISPNAFTPNASMTSLPGEVARSPIAGGVDKGSTVEVSAPFSGALQTWVRSVCFYNKDGVPLAIYSQPTGALSYKQAGEYLLLSYAIDFSVLPEGSVTVVAGAPDFSLLFTGEFATHGAYMMNLNHNLNLLKDRVKQLEEANT